MSPTTAKEMEESSIREMMEALSISEEEAHTRRAAFLKKYLGDRECIYSFLKTHNPTVARMEQEESYKRRIASLVTEMQIPENTATALVITGDVLAAGSMKILRKRKAKSTHRDFQEMLGVTAPIPQEVLDALGIENG
jgi:hypothetical protein